MTDATIPGQYLYEILIRGNATSITGAHVVYAVDTTNPLTQEPGTSIGMAQPLSMSTELPTIIGEAAATALTQVQTLEAQVKSLQDQLESVNAQVEALQQQLTEVTASTLVSQGE